MENASRALIMAAGVLIGILILSLAIFLFMDFGSTSKEIYSQIEQVQLTQYNTQYDVYVGRTDITIYEIISVANLAKENNQYYQDYTDFRQKYQVSIQLKVDNTIESDLQNKHLVEQQNLIEKYNSVDAQGKLQYIFVCNTINYHPNSGRVKKLTFEQKK